MKKSNLIGKHVIVRSNLAGVFFGILKDNANTKHHYYMIGILN